MTYNFRKSIIKLWYWWRSSFPLKVLPIHHTEALTLVTHKQLTRNNLESAGCEMWRQQPADQNTGDYYMQQPRSGARPSCILRLLYWALTYCFTSFTTNQTTSISYEWLIESEIEIFPGIGDEQNICITCFV